MTSQSETRTPQIGAWLASTREGSGRYQAGRDRVAQILDAALEIILEGGYQALSLREVARRCGVRIGAVTYYYKGRTDLLQDVLNMVLAPYAERFNAIEHAPGATADQKLEQIIRLLLEDIQTQRTTGLFPHLWALANHDRFVAQAVDSIYILERLRLTPLIGELNPRLAAQERETLALFVAASIAGSTMFIGHGKPWAGELPLYTAIACRTLIDVVKTITPEQLEAHGWRPGDRTPRWTPPTVLPDAAYRALVDGVRGQAPAAATPDGPNKGASPSRAGRSRPPEGEP
jgi:AcrR family transcriptional regulator